MPSLPARTGPLAVALGRRAAEPRVVGAKAARLAVASAAGFPVPESLVVPCSVSEPVLATAMRRAGSASVHHARLEVMEAGRPQLDGLKDELGWLGPALAVRSSSPAEDDPRLAGAFSSLIGVPPADVATAVLSVWASAILSPARDPSPGPGLGPGPDLQPEWPGWPAFPPRMAVLIQPEIQAQFAGTAEVALDGSVLVIATDGTAAPLLAGWAAGLTAQVSPSGVMSGPAGQRFGRQALLTTAELAGDVTAALGDRLIEWAWADGRVWLLQSRRASEAGAGQPGAASHPNRAAPGSWAVQHATPSGAPAGSRAARAAPLRDLELVRVLRAAGLAGALGERWLLPWAITWADQRDAAAALPDWSLEADQQEPTDQMAPRELWSQFTAVADQLTGRAWGVAPAAAGDLAGELSAALRRGALPARALAEPSLAGLAQARSLISRLAAQLRGAGVMESPVEFCALPAELGPVLRGEQAIDARRRAYLARLSWEPALYRAAELGGWRLAGTPAGPGTGCGQCLRAEDAAVLASSGSRIPAARPVLVAAYPLPWYAPLLMGAAALVTRGGSSAAHLIGVARSLGVPVVTGCEISALTGGSIAAVDGDSGAVHLLPPCPANDLLYAALGLR